jgi:predicted nucleic acid-binding protein
MIVVDTNVIISLVIEENVINDELLKNQILIAPSFLKLETLNILRKYHFLNHIQKPIIDSYFEEVLNLIDEFVEDDVILQSAYKISFSLNHPIYDCLFLALAQNKGAAFASFDKRLLVKASQIGIEVVEVG